MVKAGEKAMSSNLSAVWTRGWQETLIGGGMQGRKQFDPRGASAVCRRSMWKMMMQITALAGLPALVEVLGQERYKDVKGSEVLRARRTVKEEVKRHALKGWVKNTGDEIWGLQD